jgi:hypothetical protein
MRRLFGFKATFNNVLTVQASVTACRRDKTSSRNSALPTVDLTSILNARGQVPGSRRNKADSPVDIGAALQKTTQPLANINFTSVLRGITRTQQGTRRGGRARVAGTLTAARPKDDSVGPVDITAALNGLQKATGKFRSGSKVQALDLTSALNAIKVVSPTPPLQSPAAKRRTPTSNKENQFAHNADSNITAALNAAERAPKTIDLTSILSNIVQARPAAVVAGRGRGRGGSRGRGRGGSRRTGSALSAADLAPKNSINDEPVAENAPKYKVLFHKQPARILFHIMNYAALQLDTLPPPEYSTPFGAVVLADLSQAHDLLTPNEKVVCDLVVNPMHDHIGHVPQLMAVNVRAK